VVALIIELTKRKKKLMKQIVFEITHLDGSVARHSYDLDLKDKAREFYKRLFKDNLIAGWGIEGK
jgi:hypothetical protein